MSSELTVVITQAGRSAAMQANLAGLSVNISEIGLGDAGYVPQDTRTALASERARVPVASSNSYPDEFRVRLNFVLDNADEFWVREVGLFLEDGTLFAVWSDSLVNLGYKSSANKFLMGFNLVLDAVPAGSVNIIDEGAPLELSMAEEYAQMSKAIIDNSRRIMELHKEKQ